MGPHPYPTPFRSTTLTTAVGITPVFDHHGSARYTHSRPSMRCATIPPIDDLAWITDPASDVVQAVRARYAAAAMEMARVGRDEAGAALCCGYLGPVAGCDCGYEAQELAPLGLTWTVGLGCGNPVRLAELAPGEVVLDLGSGAGLDALLAARQVPPGGRALGIDLTQEMLGMAEANRAKAGSLNVTFIKGSIEALPLPDSIVDVVISNCAVNMAIDKRAVLGEAFRVLKPGGWRLPIRSRSRLPIRPSGRALTLGPPASAGPSPLPISVSCSQRLDSTSHRSRSTKSWTWAGRRERSALPTYGHAKPRP